jgi:hypothetical protein
MANERPIAGHKCQGFAIMTTVAWQCWQAEFRAPPVVIIVVIVVMRGRNAVKAQGVIRARAKLLCPPILMGVSVIDDVDIVCGVVTAIASTKMALRALTDASIVEEARAIKEPSAKAR